MSRTYAVEIHTAEFGAGLEGVLGERSQDLHGVVNGIDYQAWNPATDGAIAKPYSADAPEGKAPAARPSGASWAWAPGPGRWWAW